MSTGRDGENVIESQEQGSPVLNHSAILITGNELPGGLIRLVKLVKMKQHLWRYPLLLDHRRILLAPQ